MSSRVSPKISWTTSSSARKELGKPGGSAGGLVEPRQCLRCQLDRQSTQVLLQLAGAAGTQDRDQVRLPTLSQDPGDADLAGRRVRGGRDLPHQLDCFRAPLVGRVIPVASGRGRAVGVLAREDAAVEGAPGEHSQPEAGRHGNELALSFPAGEAVGQLDRRRPGPAAELRDRNRPRHDPGWRVGDPDRDDLPGGDDVIERADDLVDGGDAVPHVHPEEVDPIGAQPAQAGIQGLDEVLPMVASRVGIVGPACQRVFGRQDDAFPAAFKELPELLLRLPVGVVVGGVDEVAAAVEEEVEHPARLGQLRPPAPALAERHRAQGDLADAKGRARKQPVSQFTPTSALNRTAMKLATELQISSH